MVVWFASGQWVFVITLQVARGTRYILVTIFVIYLWEFFSGFFNNTDNHCIPRILLKMSFRNPQSSNDDILLNFQWSIHNTSRHGTYVLRFELQPIQICPQGIRGESYTQFVVRTADLNVRLVWKNNGKLIAENNLEQQLVIDGSLPRNISTYV